MIATNTSRFNVGCGSEMLRPGASCEVDDQLAAQLGGLVDAGLLRVGAPASPAKAVKSEDMTSWTPARVRNWASKRGRDEVLAALEGDITPAAREALELRLMELDEVENT